MLITVALPSSSNMINGRHSLGIGEEKNDNMATYYRKAVHDTPRCFEGQSVRSVQKMRMMRCPLRVTLLFGNQYPETTDIVKYRHCYFYLSLVYLGNVS